MDIRRLIQVTSSLVVVYVMVMLRLLQAVSLNEVCGICSAENALCQNNLIGCSKATCACLDGYRMTSLTTCKLIKDHQEPCVDSEHVCRDISMTCQGGTCRCASGYKYDGYLRKCISTSTTHLGDGCAVVNDCYQVGSDPNCKNYIGTTIECGADPGQTAPRTCRCRLGYVQPRGSFICRKPHVAEYCIESVGCAPSNKAPIDASQLTETCQSGVCTCPLAAIQQRINVMGEAYNVCMAKYFHPLLENGEACTASNQCAMKLCYSCPGESRKYCVTYDSSSARQMMSSTCLATLLCLVGTILLNIL